MKLLFHQIFALLMGVLKKIKVAEKKEILAEYEKNPRLSSSQVVEKYLDSGIELSERKVRRHRK